MTSVVGWLQKWPIFSNTLCIYAFSTIFLLSPKNCYKNLWVVILIAMVDWLQKSSSSPSILNWSFNRPYMFLLSQIPAKQWESCQRMRPCAGESAWVRSLLNIHAFTHLPPIREYMNKPTKDPQLARLAQLLVSWPTGSWAINNAYGFMPFNFYVVYYTQ